MQWFNLNKVQIELFHIVFYYFYILFSVTTKFFTCTYEVVMFYTVSFAACWDKYSLKFCCMLNKELI